MQQNHPKFKPHDLIFPIIRQDNSIQHHRTSIHIVLIISKQRQYIHTNPTLNHNKHNKSPKRINPEDPFSFLLIT